MLDGLSVAEESGAFTVAVTGAADSLMAQIAARTVLTAEGPEISFTKTKSVTAGIGVFLSLALALSNRDIDDLTGLRAALGRLPAAIDQTLDRAAPDVERLAGRLGCDEVIIAGTGPNAGVAMELALTLQESALVAAQWSDTGNLLHGPLCPLDENWLVALLVTPDDLQLSADTFRVVQALGARTLAVAPSDMTIEPAPDDTLRLTELPERILWPLLYLPILQLLTYHWTVARGLNPDSPSGSELMPTRCSRPDVLSRKPGWLSEPRPRISATVMHAMTRVAVGVDVGGTSIKAGLVEDSGRVLFQTSVPTPPRSARPDDVVEAIVAAAGEIASAANNAGLQIEGVGFGFPSIHSARPGFRRSATTSPRSKVCTIRLCVTRSERRSHAILTPTRQRWLNCASVPASATNG